MRAFLYPLNMELHASFISESLLLPAPQNSDLTFGEVTTDSRRVPEGSLFIAIKGDTFDGHDFIAQAIEKGARGIVTSRDPDPTWEAEIFHVPDTTLAARQLAGAWLRRFPKLAIIVVAGSVGKTTTKELTAALLRGKWENVLKTQGSENGYLGIPITLFKLRPAHRAAVIEIGIDDIGSMIEHLDLIKPAFSIVTAIGPEHMENLKNLETVAQEEGLALTWVAQRGGKVALNLDDPYLEPFDRKLPSAQTWAFTLDSRHLTASGAPIVRGVLKNNTLEVRAPDLDPFTLTLPIPGEHNARNLLGAVTIALQMGLNPEQLKEGLGTFQTAFGRTQIFDHPKGGKVLCDYYNSSPNAVRAALQLLKTLPHKGLWACLGDMLELGDEEERYHRDLATALEETRVNHVLLYGKRMNWLADELERRNFTGEVKHFDSHASLAECLKNTWTSGDAALIKGSRSMKMEEVWKKITS